MPEIFVRMSIRWGATPIWKTMLGVEKSSIEISAVGAPNLTIACQTLGADVPFLRGHLHRTHGLGCVCAVTETTLAKIGAKLDESEPMDATDGIHVVALDFGMKWNIARHLRSRTLQQKPKSSNSCTRCSFSAVASPR